MLRPTTRPDGSRGMRDTPAITNSFCLVGVGVWHGRMQGGHIRRRALDTDAQLPLRQWKLSSISRKQPCDQQQNENLFEWRRFSHKRSRQLRVIIVDSSLQNNCREQSYYFIDTRVEYNAHVALMLLEWCYMQTPPTSRNGRDNGGFYLTFRNVRKLVKKKRYERNTSAAIHQHQWSHCTGNIIKNNVTMWSYLHGWCKGFFFSLELKRKGENRGNCWGSLAVHSPRRQGAVFTRVLLFCFWFFLNDLEHLS